MSLWLIRIYWFALGALTGGMVATAVWVFGK